jgi:hypothetical protein
VAVQCEISSITKNKNGDFIAVIETKSPELLDTKLQIIVEAMHVKDAAEGARQKLVPRVVDIAGFRLDQTSRPESRIRRDITAESATRGTSFVRSGVDGGGSATGLAVVKGDLGRLLIGVRGLSPGRSFRKSRYCLAAATTLLSW